MANDDWEVVDDQSAQEGNENSNNDWEVVDEQPEQEEKAPDENAPEDNVQQDDEQQGAAGEDDVQLDEEQKEAEQVAIEEEDLQLDDEPRESEPEEDDLGVVEHENVQENAAQMVDDPGEVRQENAQENPVNKEDDKVEVQWEEGERQNPQQEAPRQQNPQPEGPRQEGPQQPDPQPAPVNHDKELDHNSALYNELHSDMQLSYNRLEDETVGVYFGSSEYSKAMKDVKKVADTWSELKGKNKDYQMSDYELQEARQKVLEAQQSIDTYLAKKARERNGKSLDTESGASYYRQEAMINARNTLQEQANVLDDIAAQRGMETPLPSDEKLARQRKDLADDLIDASRNVYTGSLEFDEAQKRFGKLNTLWHNTMANKREGELPSAGEIANLKASIEKTKQAADAYLDRKADVNNPKAKTEKRISTMARVRENLVVQEKKLAEWEKKLSEKEPVKDYKALADNATYLRNQMEAADRDVIGGSREFKEVNKLLKEQEQKWRDLEKKGPDYKMTPDELRDMVERNQKIEQNVDKYIADKAGKDLSEKTQKRLRAMQKVKDDTLSQRKKFEARRDEMLKEVEGVTNEQIAKENKDISLGLRDADRRVHFGSKEYKNAMQSYNRSLSTWRDYQAREAAGVATYDERNAQYRSLQDDIKKIDKYLKTKKGKDLSKHPKTQKRVEIMQKAKKNLETRMRKIEIAHEKQKRLENAVEKQQAQQRRTQLQFGIRSQRAMDRHMASASLSATKKLNELSNKKQLTALDKKNARTALAALVLEDVLKLPGNEQLKRQAAKGGKEYSKMVREIANSKTFKKTFPDAMFTPANCRNMANNQRYVGRCTNTLFGQEVHRQQVIFVRQQQRQRQMNTNMQMSAAKK